MMQEDYPKNNTLGGTISTKAEKQNDAIDDLNQHADELHRRLQMVDKRLADVLERLGIFIPEAPNDSTTPSASGLRYTLNGIGNELTSIESKLNSL